MARSQNKTQATPAPVEAYLERIADPARREDCRALVALMRRVTGCDPVMWGASIVGFDRYHYRYESGREGDSCVVGFSSGSAHISLYLMCGFETEASRALLAKLGKHKAATACLYVKRLSDVDLKVLEELVALSVAETHRRYQATPK